MAVELFPLLEPVVSEAGIELVDVEYRSGVVVVTVDRPGGVDLDTLTTVDRLVSARLDEDDPIPGSYTLEVSSPGVERTLRTPAHFAKAVGETVSVKTRPQVPGERRLTGTLVAADDTGFELEPADGGAPVRLAYTDIDRARTVFVWGPTPRPGGPRKAGPKKAEQPADEATVRHTGAEQTTERTRKQVTTP